LCGGPLPQLRSNHNFAAVGRLIGGNPVDSEFDHVMIIPKEDEEETVSAFAMIAMNSRPEALSFRGKI
jgi:hypothetical protein